MKLKIIIVVSSLISLIGCAAQNSITMVNNNNLEGKKYEIGIVKVNVMEVPLAFKASGNFKSQALESIPIDGISHVLENAFKIDISKEVDKSIKRVKETNHVGPVPQQHAGFSLTLQIPFENLYYGNLKYGELSTLSAMFGNSAELMSNTEKNYILVTYYTETSPFSFKISYKYRIELLSYGIVAGTIVGTVVKEGIPTNWGIADSKEIEKRFMANASLIPSSLEKYLAQYNNGLTNALSMRPQ